MAATPDHQELGDPLGRQTGRIRPLLAERLPGMIPSVAYADLDF